MESAFKATDFDSIQVKITCKNTTTEREIKTQDKIKLCELLERGMVLEMPSKFCEKKHYLVLKIEATDTDKKTIKFMTGGQIESIEIMSAAKTDKVTISLLQHDKAAWDLLCGLFSNRQDAIEKLFASIKGYG